MNTPSLVLRRLVVACAIAASFAYSVSLTAQIPGRNVNMVSGTIWPKGDPFLQRQNEPSIAASTRNPLHLLAGANDYRSVDLPIVLSDVDGEVGDAWLGLFTSTDGGERWTSTLVPGFPHDPSPIGQASPIYSYQAAADPVVRAGTNGLMYYAGLAFDRGPGGVHGKSAIFVARFIDNNNQEAGSPFDYINTSLVSTSPGGTTGVFLDKPWMAVDIPRQGGAVCTVVTPGEDGPITQQLPSGNVYVAFTVKSVDAGGDRYDLYFSRSTNCAASFSAPIRLSRPEDRTNQGATIVIAPNTGEVYVAWRRIDLNPADGVEEHAIVVARSSDQGNKWNPPGVARRFPRGKKLGLDPTHSPGKGTGKKNSIEQTVAAELAPFDQATSDIDLQFRTNAYPTMTADGTGRLYLAWTERGFATHPDRGDAFSGDARILMSTSTNGSTWAPPLVVSDVGQQGHQLMPALSFAGGRLMLLYYDLQEDRSTVFTRKIDDKTAFNMTTPDTRHTMDIRVSMGTPGAPPAFAPSKSVSTYLQGTRTSSSAKELMQVNPPNLPLFKLGTVPFIGDYIDIAAAPPFVLNAAGSWTYNTAATSTAPVFHVAWTDNRDVRPPFDKDWTKYTPPTYNGPRPIPGGDVILCDAGYAGSRNQNIYTARVTGGLVVGSPGNTKPLSQDLQRAFVVFAKNSVLPTLTDNGLRYYRMTILNQPPGGRASFSQFPLPPHTPESEPPLISIDVTVPAFSTATRTVYVTSSDAHAPITVDVSEISGVGAPGEVPGGLEGTIMLNPDRLNPEVENPEVENPEVENPEVENAEVYNPEVENPEVENPEVENPEVENHEIANPEVENPEVENIIVGNPDLANPEVENPEVENPEVENPEVENPEVENGALIAGGGIITDITWTIKNNGNTTTAYNINLFLRQNSLPTTGQSQLLIYRTYQTPTITMGTCDLKTVTQNVLVANIPSPDLYLPGEEPTDPNSPAKSNPSLWIEPGAIIEVTLRVFDPDKTNNIIIDGASIDPEWVPEQDVSLFAQSQPVNSEDAEAGVVEPPLVGADPVPVLTVTTTANAGPGSLREAMTVANTLPGVNTIGFNIPGPGPHVIALATLLPSQTEAVIIDASTQPGYAGTPVIELNGSAIVGGGSGFRLMGGGSRVRGLAIGGFGDYGIWMDSAGNEAYGNYVGVDVTGVALLVNGTGGVSIDGPNNIVGTMAPVDRNVIAGNSFWGVSISAGGNRVEGNYIGVDATGGTAIPQIIGVFIAGAAATGNTIGGNVISGHTQQGVLVTGPANTIEKNAIGLNAAGNAAVPNIHGVFVTGAINNRLIGNVISGNDEIGVMVQRNGAAEVSGTEITGNFIGTDATGFVAIPNRNGVAYAGAVNTILGAPGAGRNIISGNSEEGVYFANDTGTGVQSTGNVVRNNYIGVNSPGDASLGNGYSGLVFLNSSNNIVGGSNPGESNVISGNGMDGVFITAQLGATDNNVVSGNFIGVSASGVAAIPNLLRGVHVTASAPGSATGTVLGGIGATDGNTIGGNAESGVLLLGPIFNTRIDGNRIGVGIDGVTDVGNGLHGVSIRSGADSTSVGGSVRNVISGNGGIGVSVFGSTNTTVARNYIGTNAAGTAAVPNGFGIDISTTASTGTLIGGSGALGNVVSGNTNTGITLQSIGTTAINNLVGINAAGTAAIPNQVGIDVIGDNNVIGQAGLGNVVSGNTLAGIMIEGWENIVRGNRVGTNATGTAAVGNGTGIEIVSRGDVIVDAVIGGVLAGEGNVISGNTGHGMAIMQDIINPDLLNPSPANGPPWFTDVRSNLIGTAADGVSPLPNLGAGIHIDLVSLASITDGNTIANNLLGGIVGLGDSSFDAMGNTITGNGGLNIDLGGDGVTANDGGDGDAGPNLQQNYPVITAVSTAGVGNTQLDGTLSSAPNTQFTIRVYTTPTCHSSGFGGATAFFSTFNITTNPAGVAGINHLLPGVIAPGVFVTTTATDPAGNMSEFSQCVQHP